jgi:hypothetical protein
VPLARRGITGVGKGGKCGKKNPPTRSNNGASSVQAWGLIIAAPPQTYFDV